MNLQELRIGRIYKFRSDNELTRITRSGGAGFYTGRGCKPQTATPQNHIRVTDVVIPDRDEINQFLEMEMKNEMAQKNNVTMIPSRGDWKEEISSGYKGFRCKRCATWIYDNQERRCECDARKEGDWN